MFILTCTGHLCAAKCLQWPWEGEPVRPSWHFLNCNYDTFDDCYCYHYISTCATIMKLLIFLKLHYCQYISLVASLFWTLVKIEIISKLRILFYFGPELYLDSRDDVKLKGRWTKGIQGCVAISSTSSSINTIIIILINTILDLKNSSLPCSEWVWIWRWVWRTMLEVQVYLLLQQKIFVGTYFTTGIFRVDIFCGILPDGIFLKEWGRSHNYCYIIIIVT